MFLPYAILTIKK